MRSRLERRVSAQRRQPETAANPRPKKPTPREVLVTFELYRNKMPWQVPDYKTCGAGVGGNAIGVYASSSEGAVYTPVQNYKDLGYYASMRDSVYAVGLLAADWQAL